MSNREEVSWEDAGRTGKICIRWGGPGKVFPERETKWEKVQRQEVQEAVCVCVCAVVMVEDWRYDL